MNIRTTIVPPQTRCPEPIDAPEMAVVIDVLRATSVIAAALHAGATEVITFADVEEARNFKAQTSPNCMLGGERHCRPIAGFDVGNSPVDYSSATGRTVAITTTNGTAAVAWAADATEMITAAFVNYSAVIEQIATRDHVHLICAGTAGMVSGEDVLLAGGMLVDLQSRGVIPNDRIDDASRIAIAFWRQSFADTAASQVDSKALRDALASGLGGRNLVATNFDRDIDDCANVDSHPVCPRRVDGSTRQFKNWTA